ncbi:MAG: NUDIX domain-containing protein [Candidatus Woesearchaeota archaeon]
MIDEFIDVVDEKDRIIKKMRRSLCHKRNLRHRRVAVLIFKNDSYRETLLQKRSKSKDVAPGKWAHLEGHLCSGDSYLDAAKRETEEEMFNGRKLNQKLKLEKLFKFKSSLDGDEVFITVFRAVLPGPFHLQKEEVDRYKFVKIKDLIKNVKSHPRKYTETCRLLFREYGEEFFKHVRRNY